MIQKPKHITKNFRNRNYAFGRERRLNMHKEVLEKTPHFPKTLTYEDIDWEVFNWVDKTLEVVYDGKLFNTYKLFSNQRITEYGQTWQNLDEKGNLDINFKTITRESNPQKGEIQGGFQNIPGDIKFPIFSVRSLDENGIEYNEVYSMKQPTQCNLIYTVGIFTNTYAKLNEMNVMIHQEFRGLERYIFPNGFAIPMELNSISDESEYTIDDRKYYSQTYQIKVMAYVITKDDYSVAKVPSRVKVQFVSGVNSGRRKKEEVEVQGMMGGTPISKVVEKKECETKYIIESATTENSIEEIMTKLVRPAEIEIEELCGQQVCWKGTEDEFYVNRKVVYNINLNYCSNSIVFESEYHLGVESISLKNIKSCRIFIDDILVNIEDSDVEILKSDKIRVEVDVVDEKEDGMMNIICYDLDSIGGEGETEVITLEKK